MKDTHLAIIVGTIIFVFILILILPSPNRDWVRKFKYTVVDGNSHYQTNRIDTNKNCLIFYHYFQSVADYTIYDSSHVCTCNSYSIITNK